MAAREFAQPELLLLLLVLLSLTARFATLQIRRMQRCRADIQIHYT